MKFDILKDFRDDENGGILAFSLIMFLTMVVGGGMAIDFINHEMRREAVQDAMDRGVLAAAASAKAAGAKTDAEIAAAEAAAISRVRSYITISGFDPDDMGVVVTPDITADHQRIDVAANFSVDTYFLRLSGINTLDGQAVSGAEVKKSNIEMSLVFDVSGSMASKLIVNREIVTRMSLLKAAAKEFASIMLNGDSSEYTSISVVPFSGQVAIPQVMANQYTNFGRRDPWHTYSNCVAFGWRDYNTTRIRRNQMLTQYQHFNSFGSPWCPGHESEVLPLANNLTKINAMLDGMSPQGNTNTWTGIKWGAALLDPYTRPIVRRLANICSHGECVVDREFRNRPANYSDEDTLKFIIVMTDGQNTPEMVIPTDDYNFDGSDEVYTQSNANHWDAVDAVDVLYPYDGNWNPAPGAIRATGKQGDRRMQRICNAAKRRDIVIFTIGVDIDAGGTAYRQMRDCASTPGHFYSVGSANMADAFEGIANTILKLRLVN